jgi:enoyl-CoA hydratase
MIDRETYKTIRIDYDDRIVTLTLNRPERLNAVDEQMHLELSRIFREVDDDPSSDVVVLTGAGRAFCAGGDLRAGDFSKAFGIARGEGERIVRDLVHMEKPIIAAVNGPARGLGATIALFCDVVFAAESATIGDPHVRVGLVAGDGGAVIWPLLIGVNRAKEFLMSGDSLDAHEAERIGLINHVVPDEQLVEAVRVFARKLARGAPMAIRGTKVSINKYLQLMVTLILDMSLSIEARTYHSPDNIEAGKAFAEKREPRFSTGASEDL